VIASLFGVLISALLTAAVAFAQVPSAAGAPAGEYSDFHQGGRPPLAIRVVTGRVLAETGQPAKEAGPLRGANLSLFAGTGHRLVASMVSDAEGRFAFDAINPGLYRLVVRDPHNALCTASRMVQVYPRGQGPVPKSIGLVIRLRPAGADGSSSILWE